MGMLFWSEGSTFCFEACGFGGGDVKAWLAQLVRLAGGRI